MRSYKPFFSTNPNLQIHSVPTFNCAKESGINISDLHFHFTIYNNNQFFFLTSAPLVTAGAEPAAACDGGGADYDDCGGCCGCGGSDGG